MNALRLVGAGIGFAVAVTLWPLALLGVLDLLLVALLRSNRPPASATAPLSGPPFEPLLGKLSRQELAKVAERNRETLEICYLISERN